MKSALFLLTTFVLSVNSFWAQTNETTSKKVISVCSFQIGENGRAANFRFSFSYILEVNKGGEIIKIGELASTKEFSATKFVRDDLFKDCMKKWRLEPAGNYFVQFNVGSGSIGTSKDMPRDYMLIVDPGKQSLVVELSLSESETAEQK